jgi:hypothetical protein
MSKPSLRTVQWTYITAPAQGRVGWLESCPPQPVDLAPIDPNFEENYSPPLAEEVA